MMLLLVTLWPWLAGAAVLGLGIGWLSGPPKGLVAPAVLTLALAAAWGIALAEILPGRAGFFAESFALILPAYLAGCLAGAGLSLPGRRAT